MKTVIITGGGGSIGANCAQLFGENGWQCVIVDTDLDRADSVVSDIGGNSGDHLSVRADVADAGDIEELVRQTIRKFGSITALVNCAAGARHTLSKDDNVEERWDKTIENDLKSIYLLSERVVVEMAQSGGGSIINLSSIAGSLIGSHSVPYAAAKAGIIGITKSHARIYGAFNIRVNCVLPGIIDTPMVRDSKVEKTNDYFSQIREQTPLKRWGDPKEIAELILFLASDKCGFLTGASLLVDGGATLTLGPRLDETIPFKWEKWPPDSTGPTPAV